MTASAATCTVMGVWSLFAPGSFADMYGVKMGPQAGVTLGIMVQHMGAAICNCALIGWVLRDHPTAKVLGLTAVGWVIPIAPQVMALADKDLGDVSGTTAGHYFNIALCVTFAGLLGYFAVNQKSYKKSHFLVDALIDFDPRLEMHVSTLMATTKTDRTDRYIDDAG